jgi:hypothetical protein
MENDLFDYLVDLERSLHKESTRKSKEKLDELLHDDFEEISASGIKFVIKRYCTTKIQNKN